VLDIKQANTNDINMNVDHAKFAVCTKITTTGATSGAGFAYPSGVSEFTLIFSEVRVA
jgi:hypothetical protein